MYINKPSATKIEAPDRVNPIRTRGCFPPGSRFFTNNFGSNKGTQSKLSDFS